jgi:hypothetical protein
VLDEELILLGLETLHLLQLEVAQHGGEGRHIKAP